MPTHGGARKGAGRPATGKTTTKATIYKSDRELIKSYALSLGISVNELIHRVFTNPKFEDYLRNINNQN